MKRQVEIYILADGSACCQREKLKHQPRCQAHQAFGLGGVLKELGQTEVVVMSKRNWHSDFREGRSLDLLKSP